jgi:hypothetical protein
MPDDTNDATYLIQRIWDGGGWRVIQKQVDGTEVRIADFISHRDATEYVQMKLGERVRPHLGLTPLIEDVCPIHRHGVPFRPDAVPAE